jgi:hypothetical protein
MKTFILTAMVAFAAASGVIVTAQPAAAGMVCTFVAPDHRMCAYTPDRPRYNPTPPPGQPAYRTVPLAERFKQQYGMNFYRR